MINPKGTTITNPDNRVNNRAVFTGETLLTVEAVNPDKDQIVDIKGLESIKDRVEEPQYVDILLKGDPYTKIDFLLSFNPTRMYESHKMTPPNVYPEKMFVNYPIFLSDELALNKAGDKCQVIDDHNQSSWIAYEPGKNAADALKEAIASGSDYLETMNPDTVRWALKGEVLLYDFLFNMTTLSRHNPENGKELSGFVLGGDPKKATEVLKSVIKGNFKPVQEVVGSEITRYDDGKVAKIGGLLGVRVNNSDPNNVRFYQEIFSHPMDVCTFRESYKRGEKRGPHTTRLSKGAYERLTHKEYGWRHEWNNSMDFQEYDIDSYEMPETSERGTTNKKGDSLPF